MSEEEKIQSHTVEINKLKRAKDSRNVTSDPLQKALMDKVKEQ